MYSPKTIINRQKLKDIKFLALDVDGILTDGGLHYSNQGEITRIFDVKDGLAIKFLQQNGFRIAFISGGKGESIKLRAKDLGVKECFTSVQNKYQALLNLQKKLSYTKRETIYLGDDINDLVVMPLVNIFVSTSDSVDIVKKRSHIVLKSRGGKGAFRELFDLLVKKNPKLKFRYKDDWFETN